ncbi:hypothetical protein [Bordetella sp. LUAb4]|uniref:hypothetical protein n=1 Tax=Bordetella sp. LUAb4 TaxID=2843195 RepID=UPI001E4B5AF1|nr:hypothetical protein [Bordetella sp. LUAb4]
MKIPRLRQLVLGSAFTLLLNAAAWADHTYTVNFAVDTPPNDWKVMIGTPKGYAPNSECMTTWAVPDKVQFIGVNHDNGYAAKQPDRTRFFTVQIRDKDVGGCQRQPKYNTWTFDIIPSGPDGYSKRLSGEVQFYHYLDGGGMWMTAIKARNTDDKNNKLYVSSAICDHGVFVWMDCLNNFVSGDYAAEQIWISFRY